MAGLAAALAAEMLLVAAAKWSTRHGSAPTLLAVVLPRIRVVAAIVADLLCAVLLMLPRVRDAGAGAVLVMIVSGATLAVARRGYKLPCGCFGVPERAVGWRDWATRSLLAMQAFLVLVGWPRVGFALVGWVIGAVCVAVLVALQPHLIKVWVHHGAPASSRDALRVLAASEVLGPWRSALLSDTPAEVTAKGHTVQVVLDAWAGGRPVLLIASVTGKRVRLHARDAVSLAPLVDGGV